MTEPEALRFAVFALAAAVLLLAWRLTVTTNALRRFRRRRREIARILEVGGARGSSPDEIAAFVAATLREDDGR
jgi:hypothetical protein